MGRATDRFGNRRHPLFQHAKELANSAVQTSAGTDTRALAGLLDAKMDTLGADEFETVIGMATLELRQRKNANDAVQVLVSTTLEVSEGGQRDADELPGSLFGLVLRVSDQADNAEALAEAQLNAVVDAMVRHRLLASQASAVMLPQLLSPGVAQSLLAGDVYALSRSLLNGDVATAMSVVQSRKRLRQGTGLQTAERSGGVVVLVGVAGAPGGVVFPVSEELAAQAHSGVFEGLVTGAGYLSQKAMDDMNHALTALSADISTVLGRGAVHLVQPAIAFAQAGQQALHLERSDAALAVLQQVAQQEANGRMELLSIGQPAPSEEGFLMPVARKVGGQAVAHFRWPVARYEPPRDALIQLLSFLQTQGLEVLPAGGPATGMLH